MLWALHLFRFHRRLEEGGGDQMSLWRTGGESAVRPKDPFPCFLNRISLAWVVALLILFGASSAVARAETNEPSPVTESAQFRITHLAFDPDGKLHVAPESLRPGVTSFFYGEPVTNVVFRTEFSEPSGRHGYAPLPHEPAQPEMRRNAPPRPVRPQYRIDRWSREHGLPGNKVNALLQTRDGYLWIGTVGGLARFDGVQFTVFNESNTPEMEANGSIGRALFEDADGRLWIGTERGLLCYSRGRFAGFPGQEELQGSEVRCFASRAAGGFWIGAGQRLGFWDGSAVGWRSEVQIEPGKFILSLAEDADGMLWIGTMRGLFGFDLKAGRVARTLFAKDQTVTITGLMLDQRQRLWIGSRLGTWRLERGASEPVAVGSEPRGTAFSIPYNARFAEDAGGVVWATTSSAKGLVRFSDGADGFEGVQIAEELAETLCVHADREGVVWVGGQDRGLFRLRSRPFATLATGSGRAWDHVRAVTEGKDGSLWFSSQFYIGHWSRRDITLFDTRTFLPLQISAMGLFPSGEVWAGFPRGGVFEPPRLASDPRLFLPATPRFPEVGSAQVIYTRRDGSVWLGASNGLYQVTGKSTLEDKRFEQHLHTNQNSVSGGSRGNQSLTSPSSIARLLTPTAAKSVERMESLSGQDIRVLLEDRHTNLWIGTAGGGLTRVGRDGVRAFTNRDGLGHDHVAALHESEDGSLWIGTPAGLCRFREGRLDRFKLDSAVPQRLIHCILEDEFGRLWLSHNAGVSRVARKELDAWLLDKSVVPAVANFGSADGMLNPETSGESQPAGVKGSDGRLWFPTRGGLVVVNPAECPTNIPAPQVTIEQVVANGERVSVADRVQLAPGKGRHLEIRYTATSLHSPEQVRIRFRLEGHDPGWRESGSVRQAIYASLRPGGYQFRVQARNHEGRWSERDAVLAFRVAPYFWQTRLFHVTSGFVVVGTVGGLLAWRLRRQQRRLEVERVKSLELERLRIARDMHDHLGAQLAGIALASGDNDSAHQRARETLRELNDLIWSVHPNNDTLPGLADFIANFAGRYLAAAGVALDLDLPDNIPQVAIQSQLRHEIAAMFKQALRNVTQHALAKRVVVRLRIDGDQLALCVRDDGRGFDPSRLPVAVGQEGRVDERRPAASGNGLRNFHTRCASLGGLCRIHSAPDQGTEVEFIVPLNNHS